MKYLWKNQKNQKIKKLKIILNENKKLFLTKIKNYS